MDREWLRGRTSGSKQRTEEVMVVSVHHTVRICIFPPASAQVTGVTGTELGGAVYNLLEPAFERQRIFYDERVIIQSLAGDKHDTRRLITASCRGRDGCQKCDEYYDEKQS